MMIFSKIQELLGYMQELLGYMFSVNTKPFDETKFQTESPHQYSVCDVHIIEKPEDDKSDDKEPVDEKTLFDNFIKSFVTYDIDSVNASLTELRQSLKHTEHMNPSSMYIDRFKHSIDTLKRYPDIIRKGFDKTTSIEDAIIYFHDNGYNVSFNSIDDYYKAIPSNICKKYEDTKKLNIFDLFNIITVRKYRSRDELSTTILFGVVMNYNCLLHNPIKNNLFFIDTWNSAEYEESGFVKIINKINKEIDD